MVKEKDILKEIIRQWKQLQQTFLDILKILRDMIKILKEYGRVTATNLNAVGAIGFYVGLYRQVRIVSEMIKSLDEDIKHDEKFERELLREEEHLDEILAEHRVSDRWGQVKIRENIQSNMNFFDVQGPKERKIKSILLHLKDIDAIFFNYRKNIHVPGLSYSEEGYLTAYRGERSRIEELGLKKQCRDLMINITKVLVIIKRIIKFIQLEREYEGKIDSLLKDQILPTFRREIKIMTKDYPEEEFVEETRILREQLQELGALV